MTVPPGLGGNRVPWGGAGHGGVGVSDGVFGSRGLAALGARQGVGACRDGISRPPPPVSRAARETGRAGPGRAAARPARRPGRVPGARSRACGAGVGVQGRQRPCGCRRIYLPPPLSKLRPCPSYSRRRDRINLVLWRSLDKGEGYQTGRATALVSGMDKGKRQEANSNALGRHANPPPQEAGGGIPSLPFRMY